MQVSASLWWCGSLPSRCVQQSGDKFVILLAPALDTASMRMRIF